MLHHHLHDLHHYFKPAPPVHHWWKYHSQLCTLGHSWLLQYSQKMPTALTEIFSIRWCCSPNKVSWPLTNFCFASLHCNYMICNLVCKSRTCNWPHPLLTTPPKLLIMHNVPPTAKILVRTLLHPDYVPSVFSYSKRASTYTSARDLRAAKRSHLRSTTSAEMKGTRTSCRSTLAEIAEQG